MRKFFDSKITKVVFTVLVVVLLYLYMCCVFMPKNPEDRGFAKYYNTRLITKEELISETNKLYNNYIICFLSKKEKFLCCFII